jgi:hypothetical protein
MIQPGGQAGGPKQNIKAMQVLCAALMAGVVFFVIIIVVITRVNGPMLDKEVIKYQDIFLYTAIGLAIVCFVIARSLYNKKMAVINNTATLLADKLNQYQAILIKYMAPCEGAALFSVIVFFLTGNFLVLLVTASMLVAMFIKYPLRGRIISELSLDWKEQQEII